MNESRVDPLDESLRSPYVGPRPFSERQENLFYGRENEVQDLLSLVTAYSEVLVYAESGAGKTSLLNAGLIPHLRKNNFRVFRSARVAGALPDGITSDISNHCVFHALRHWVSESPDTLCKLSILDFLRSIPESEPENFQPTVLIFDQLEEMFRYYQERPADRGDFIKQLGDALRQIPRLRIVLSIREDYIGQLIPYSEKLPERLRMQFRLEKLREEEALRAVTEPLKLGVPVRSFAPGVAENLVNDLRKAKFVDVEGKTFEALDQSVEPVQLQVVCQELWKNLSSDVTVIDEQHLKRFGNITDALSRFYEDCVREAAQVSGLLEANIRRWVERALITPAGTRSLILKEKESTGGIPDVALGVMENQYHLIRREVRAGSVWYELSHDRFIEPIQESNRKWEVSMGPGAVFQRTLRERAKKWIDSGYKKGLHVISFEVICDDNH